MTLRDLRRHIGQLAIVGFAGERLPEEVRSLAREFDLGGIILFARNVAEPEQVAELVAEAKGLARDVPLWVSVDQEGGRVARLRAPFTKWPPMATLGRSGDRKLAGRFAQALAAELQAVGVSLDYAPVLDVLTNAKNPVIGDRAIADTPEKVAELGRVIIETLQAAGIAACGKHFPGHGDTSADSHHELPVIEHGPDRLRAVELVPFKAAIAAGVAAIIMAHVLVLSLDDQRPATLSRRIVYDLLRDEMGFDGLILTDDVDMKALADRYTVEEAAVGAIAAGCDGLLLCGPDHERHARALEALIHAVEEDQLRPTRVEDAMGRQMRVKGRFLTSRAPRPRPDALHAILGRDEHQRVADEMAEFL